MLVEFFDFNPLFLFQRGRYHLQPMGGPTRRWKIDLMADYLVFLGCTTSKLFNNYGQGLVAAPTQFYSF